MPPPPAPPVFRSTVNSLFLRLSHASLLLPPPLGKEAGSPLSLPRWLPHNRQLHMDQDKKARGSRAGSLTKGNTPLVTSWKPEQDVALKIRISTK